MGTRREIIGVAQGVRAGDRAVNIDFDAQSATVAPDGGEWRCEVKHDSFIGDTYQIQDRLGPFAVITEKSYADQILRDHNSVRMLTEALAALVAADNCNYDRDTMRSDGYFDRARAALALAEGEVRECRYCAFNGTDVLTHNPDAHAENGDPDTAQAEFQAKLRDVMLSNPLVKEIDLL